MLYFDIFSGLSAREHVVDAVTVNHINTNLDEKTALTVSFVVSGAVAVDLDL